MRNNYVFISILAFLVASVSGLTGFNIGKHHRQEIQSISPLEERPFDVYKIENLAKYKPQPSLIKLERVLRKEKDFTSYLFSFSFNPNPAKSEKKETTGLINIPQGQGPFPLIVMFRGYVDQKIYKTGDGTRRAGEYFANNGFITIAPDFLGYGESNQEAGNIFEARFQTYTTALSLLSSLSAIEQWNHETIFLWAHSNGGQIALTILEITGAKYPATLWAPVSKTFPYSILYYTDQSEDGGKLIRRELAKFEELYNTDLFSIHNYFDKIQAPIQIHQGTADEAVPVTWSNQLVNELKDLGLDVNYFKYSGSDHNFIPDWNRVIERDLAFFKKYQI